MDKIAILDAGSQYGKVIDRRVRELCCDTDLLPLDTSIDKLKEYRGIIISGGPTSVYGEDALKYDKRLFELCEDGVPILGICLGMQIINYHFGGSVTGGKDGFYGQTDIKIFGSELFNGLNETETVLLTHSDVVEDPPECIETVAKSVSGVICGIQHTDLPLYGVQFHPEVDLTVNGKKIFENFLYNICRMEGAHTVENMLDTMLEEIRDTVGNRNVVVLVSGGVDSSVCCALMYKALGSEKVLGIHIDTGFMRKDESTVVYDALKKNGFDLQVLNCKEEFFNGETVVGGKITPELKYAVDPETKRKIIGDTFMKITDREIKKLELTNYLICQGTLRPDLIESASEIASSNAQVIKTHHNDTDIVKEKRKLGQIIEPLKDLHKDEVRQLGRLLGLPDELVDRHPFPGPGLAIRILCAEIPYLGSSKEEFNKLNEQLAKFLEPYGLTGFLLPIRSVGVQGDGRSYSFAAAIAGFTTISETEFKTLFKLCGEITKQMKMVNRVVYLLNSNKDGHKFNIIPTLLNEVIVDYLRKADHIVTEAFKDCKTISQVPTVLLPVGYDGKRSVVIRPFITNDFMTGRPPVPGHDINVEVLDGVVEQLEATDKYSGIFFDLTSKPPGTTEWE